MPQQSRCRRLPVAHPHSTFFYRQRCGQGLQTISNRLTLLCGIIPISTGCDVTNARICTDGPKTTSSLIIITATTPSLLASPDSLSNAGWREQPASRNCGLPRCVTMRQSLKRPVLTCGLYRELAMCGTLTVTNVKLKASHKHHLPDYP